MERNVHSFLKEKWGTWMREITESWEWWKWYPSTHRVLLVAGLDELYRYSAYLVLQYRILYDFSYCTGVRYRTQDAYTINYGPGCCHSGRPVTIPSHCISTTRNALQNLTTTKHLPDPDPVNHQDVVDFTALLVNNAVSLRRNASSLHFSWTPPAQSSCVRIR